MGKATKWLRGLLWMKKDKENVDVLNCDRRDKKRWSFGKSRKDSVTHSGQAPANLANPESAWLRSYTSETEKEQSKHAIALAAATAAAADAAVAAAHAAVAVVRLTSQGRGALFAGGRDRWAAVRIQTFFRGYLARKALRALRGLVKLQAHVRGYLVRRRAAATLQSMQALLRVQSAVRSQRARLSSVKKDNRSHTDVRHRNSTERFDESRSDQFHSRRLSSSYEANINSFEGSPKIVEIDTYRPRSSRRIAACLSDLGDDPQYQSMSSPLPCPIPARLSTRECRHNQDFDWGYIGDECRFSTAQSTPRFAGVAQHHKHHQPGTPAKSVCGDSFFRPYTNGPSYMANTQSSSAKLRSHSAPKQRPEPGTKKRISLNEIMASRSSFSGVRMQRSYYHHVKDHAHY